MKKKKVLLALLASLCVAASATAFAACQNNTTSEPTPDPALYAVYQTYAAGEEEPMSYEAWIDNLLEMIANGGYEGPAGENGKDGVGIKDINIVSDANGNKSFKFTYTDGTEKTVPID